MVWRPPLAPAGHPCHCGWRDRRAGSFPHRRLEGWVDRAAGRTCGLRGRGRPLPREVGDTDPSPLSPAFLAVLLTDRAGRKPAGEGALSYSGPLGGDKVWGQGEVCPTGGVWGRRAVCGRVMADTHTRADHGPGSL